MRGIEGDRQFYKSMALRTAGAVSAAVLIGASLGVITEPKPIYAQEEADKVKPTATPPAVSGPELTTPKVTPTPIFRPEPSKPISEMSDEELDAFFERMGQRPVDWEIVDDPSQSSSKAPSR